RTRSSSNAACPPGRRAGAGDLRNLPGAAATSPWRRPRFSTTRTRAARRATPMSASSASPTGRCVCPPWKTSSTDEPSTRRSSPKPRLPPPPPSTRRTISTPAPPTVARSSERWSNARSSARPLKLHPAGAYMSVRFRVNGQEVEVEVEPRLTLADCLRHHLRLTGTHVGCEHGVCGACTVIVDGAAVRSCLVLAVQAEGAQIVTVEGLSNDAELTPLQKAFRKHHGLQCGFCAAGMITTGHALLSEEPDCDAARVREVLSGNLCRCTGYISIVEAVLDARAAYQPKPGARDRRGDRA